MAYVAMVLGDSGGQTRLEQHDNVRGPRALRRRADRDVRRRCGALNIRSQRWARTRSSALFARTGPGQRTAKPKNLVRPARWAVIERTLGPDHPWFRAMAWVTLANLRDDAGDHAGSRGDQSPRASPSSRKTHLTGTIARRRRLLKQPWGTCSAQKNDNVGPPTRCSDARLEIGRSRAGAGQLLSSCPRRCRTWASSRGRAQGLRGRADDYARALRHSASGSSGADHPDLAGLLNNLAMSIAPRARTAWRLAMHFRAPAPLGSAAAGP